MNVVTDAISLIDQVQNTRLWFFIKAMFLLFASALAFFGSLEVFMMLYIYAIFSLVSGMITMIMSAMNPINDRQYMSFGMVIGLTNFLMGLVFLIWPYFFAQVWLIVFVLGLMLDGLYVSSALLSVKAMGASKVWPIIGGIAVLAYGIVYIVKIMTYPMEAVGMNSNISSFAMYLLFTAVFYLITVAVIKPTNVFTSVVNKFGREVERDINREVKKITRAQATPSKQPAKKAVKTSKKR